MLNTYAKSTIVKRVTGSCKMSFICLYSCVYSEQYISGNMHPDHIVAKLSFICDAASFHYIYITCGKNSAFESGIHVVFFSKSHFCFVLVKILKLAG